MFLMSQMGIKFSLQHYAHFLKVLSWVVIMVNFVYGFVSSMAQAMNNKSFNLSESGQQHKNEHQM